LFCGQRKLHQKEEIMKGLFVSLFVIVALLFAVVPIMASDQSRDGPLMSAIIIQLNDLDVAYTAQGISIDQPEAVQYVPNTAAAVVSVILLDTMPRARDVSAQTMTSLSYVSAMNLRETTHGSVLAQQFQFSS
jgi:hypothetical protein